MTNYDIYIVKLHAATPDEAFIIAGVFLDVRDAGAAVIKLNTVIEDFGLSLYTTIQEVGIEVRDDVYGDPSRSTLSTRKSMPGDTLYEHREFGELRALEIDDELRGMGWEA